MRSHNGERTHVCSFCGKSFTESQGLKAHIRTHTGEKPYVCMVCGHAFAQSGALATHRKIHQNESTAKRNHDIKTENNGLF